MRGQLDRPDVTLTAWFVPAAACITCVLCRPTYQLSRRWIYLLRYLAASGDRRRQWNPTYSTDVVGKVGTGDFTRKERTQKPAQTTQLHRSSDEA
ncbi:hypothetical protein F4679DRAFT_512167 [Xylaria curta]|nr:hypothetical protein F4679DRAFT_512167 [Xylaria curta]